MRKASPLLALLLGCAAAQSASVQLPPDTPPLTMNALPYGTIQIAAGVYFIPNYFDSGVALTIQSPSPMRIASFDETAKALAEWKKSLKPVANDRAAPLPNVSINLSPTHDATPAAPSFPSDAEVWKSTPTLTVSATRASTPAPLPKGLKVSFERHGTQVRVFLSNNGTQVLRLTPENLSVTQQNHVLGTSITIRDSKTGVATGQFQPRSSLIGTVLVPNATNATMTLTWTGTDESGTPFTLTFTQ